VLSRCLPSTLLRQELARLNFDMSEKDVKAFVEDELNGCCDVGDAYSIIKRWQIEQVRKVATREARLKAAAERVQQRGLVASRPVRGDGEGERTERSQASAAGEKVTAFAVPPDWPDRETAIGSDKSFWLARKGRIARGSRGQSVKVEWYALQEVGGRV
jgi:hypothetical protein